jgi:hypothetical protein
MLLAALRDRELTKITFKPKEKAQEFLNPQGRFKHLCLRMNDAQEGPG